MKIKFSLLILPVLILSFGFVFTARAQNVAPPLAATAALPSLQSGQANGTAIPSGEQPLPDAAAKTPLTPELLILKQVEQALREKYKKEIYIPPSIQSLIFTTSQQSLLREARGGFNTKVPAGDEKDLSNEPESAKTDLQNSQSGVRSLSLGGIVFIGASNWTIWLNKKLVTQSKIPSQAIDLRVHKDFIEIRWFDARTNKIFPIRLRPNQTFNLDAQTFVPG